MAVAYCPPGFEVPAQSPYLDRGVKLRGICNAVQSTVVLSGTEHWQPVAGLGVPSRQTFRQVLLLSTSPEYGCVCCGTLFRFESHPQGGLPPQLVVPVLRNCQRPIRIWLVNYVRLHLHVQGRSGCAECRHASLTTVPCNLHGAALGPSRSPKCSLLDPAPHARVVAAHFRVRWAPAAPGAVW